MRLISFQHCWYSPQCLLKSGSSGGIQLMLDDVGWNVQTNPTPVGRASHRNINPKVMGSFPVESCMNFFLGYTLHHNFDDHIFH